MAVILLFVTSKIIKLRLFLHFQDTVSDSDQEPDLISNSELEQNPLRDIQDEIIEECPENPEYPENPEFPENPEDQEEEEDGNINASNNHAFHHSNVLSSTTQEKQNRETPRGILNDVTNASNLQRPGQKTGNLNGRMKRLQRNLVKSRTAKLEAKLNLLSENFKKFVENTSGKQNQENVLLPFENCTESLQEVNNTKVNLFSN